MYEAKMAILAVYYAAFSWPNRRLFDSSNAYFREKKTKRIGGGVTNNAHLSNTTGKAILNPMCNPGYVCVEIYAH